MNNRRKSPRLNPTIVTSLSSIKSSSSSNSPQSSSSSDSRLIEPNLSSPTASSISKLKRAKSKGHSVIPAKRTNKSKLLNSSNSNHNKKQKNGQSAISKSNKSFKTVTKSKSEISKRHYRKKTRQAKAKQANNTPEVQTTANLGVQQQQTSTANTSAVLEGTNSARNQSSQQNQRAHVVNSNTIGPLSLNNESLISSIDLISLNLLNDVTTQDLKLQLKKATIKFEKACRQLITLDQHINDLQNSYSNSLENDRKTFKILFRMQLATLEGTHNAYIEYIERQVEKIKKLKRLLFNESSQQLSSNMVSVATNTINSN